MFLIFTDKKICVVSFQAPFNQNARLALLFVEEFVLQVPLLIQANESCSMLQYFQCKKLIHRDEVICKLENGTY